MSNYRVSIISPEEGREAIARLKSGPENKEHRRTALLQGGLEMKGSFEITCRNAKTGEVDWTHADENLITDYGKRYWMTNRFSSFRISFWASTEAPTTGRYSASGDSTQIFSSGNLTPSNNPTTNTKTVSTTFTTPGTNRTLGSILVTPPNVNPSANGYLAGVMAYALLTPPKTQTTTQTLEVVYKISMNPIE